MSHPSSSTPSKSRASAGENGEKAPRRDSTAAQSPKHVAGSSRKSVDNVAARILKRLEGLEKRLESMANVSKPDTQVADSAVEQIQQSVKEQNRAITSIATAFAALQKSLPSTVAELMLNHTPVAKVIPADQKKDVRKPEPLVTKSSQADRWSEIRNAFLANEAGADAPSEPEPPDNAVTVSEVPVANEGPELGICEETVAFLREIPTLVNPSDVPDDQLRTALIDRDRFVAALTDRLHKKFRRSQPMSTDQLREISATLPEQLHRHAEETIRSLDNQIRLGELELSLERARVGRQIAALELTREKLASAARALGLTLNEDGTIDGEVDTRLKGSKSRRWLGAMGFGI